VSWFSTRGFSAAPVLASVLIVTLVLTPGVTKDGSAPPRPAPEQTVTNTQRGFAMPTYSREGYQSPQAARYLRQIAAVGAKWVQINPTWYQDQVHTSTIAATSKTPSDAAVERVISVAHEVGLKVLLKPLLDVLPDGGTYRGTIRPDDRAAWFASYAAFIGHYAELAARLRVAEFAVGTELAGVSQDRAGWLGVVAAVRARYGGQLLYAANFDEYRRVVFWDAVDLVGIDAYWTLSRRPTADVSTLQRAWNPIVRELAAFAARTGRRILFTEAGYTSQRGSTTAPWSWTTSSTPDPAEQAAAYQALLASMDGQRWWAGVFWWVWAVPPGEKTSDPLGYTPRGKPAETVVRRWWT
jgi:hypothetical protein